MKIYMWILLCVLPLGVNVAKQNPIKRQYTVYKNVGIRVIDVPYNKRGECIRWHRYTDTLTVTLEVSSKVTYLHKYNSTWKYRTPNDGVLWYTNDMEQHASNAMRWYYDGNVEAIIIEYFRDTNRTSDDLTRRETLHDIQITSIWK